VAYFDFKVIAVTVGIPRLAANRRCIHFNKATTSCRWRIDIASHHGMLMGMWLSRGLKSTELRAWLPVWPLALE